MRLIIGQIYPSHMLVLQHCEAVTPSSAEACACTSLVSCAQQAQPPEGDECDMDMLKFSAERLQHVIWPISLSASQLVLGFHMPTVPA
jgi:hypothetical protein